VAEHGDLQLPVLDARAYEQTEQRAQDPIQERRQHGRSLTGSPGLRQTHVSRPIGFVYPPGRRSGGRAGASTGAGNSWRHTRGDIGDD
jgi:hypothetical protein